MQNRCLAERKKLGWGGGWWTSVFMILLMLMLVLIESAGADSFRCGRKIVRTGDSPGDLLETCGKPRHKDKGYENLREHGSQKKVRVERWYYKKSSRRLEQVVVIHKGRIIAIDTGKR